MAPAPERVGPFFYKYLNSSDLGEPEHDLHKKWLQVHEPRLERVGAGRPVDQEPAVHINREVRPVFLQILKL